MSPGDLVMWNVYDHPRDYPDWFVVRACFIGAGRVTMAPMATLCTTLEQAHEQIPEGCVNLGPDTEDPVIVEVWV